MMVKVSCTQVLINLHRINMRIEHRVLRFTFHVTSWLLLITFSFLIEENFSLRTPVQHTLIRVFVHALVFYVTYLLLMPILYKKRIWLFIVLSLGLLLGTVFLKQHIMHSFREGRVDREMRNNRLEDVGGGRSELFYTDKGSLRPRPMRGRPFFLLDLVVLFLFYVMAFSLRFVRKWQDDEKLKTLLAKEKVQTELQFLKQQINPHFLFNSLNSIYSLSLIKSDKTTDSILKLSSILRYMLYGSEGAMVNLSDEVSIVKNYVDLQKLRLTEVVDLNLAIHGESGGYKIAPFLLIPIIENAFKYGADNLHPSFINILLMVENDLLSLSVTNKIVQKHNVDDKNSGIGLKNIKRRLELLYSNSYTFETQKTNGTFTVVLELKLNK